MTDVTADLGTVDELAARARQARPGRALLTLIAAAAIASGWAAGRFFLSLGWLAGRAVLLGAFCAEAVIYGFRAGAKMSAAPAPGAPPGGAPDR